MRKVRLLDKQGALVKSSFSAREVTEAKRGELSKAFNFACRNPACGARFHWKKEVRPRGNSVYLDPTFVRDKDTAHAPGCAFDYGTLAIEQDSYEDDGQLHVRLNFSLGGQPDDRFAPVGPRDFLGELQRREGSVKIKKEPVDSLRALTDLLEKKFGSLEHVPQGKADFEYHGAQYRWDDLFIASDAYQKLYQKTYGRIDRRDNPPVIAVVKPVREMKENDKGKRRFVCAGQYVRDGKQEFALKPILVCEDPQIARYMERLIVNDRTLLVAGRPHASRGYLFQHGEAMSYFNLHHVAQLAQIDTKKYWRYGPSNKHQQDFLEQLAARP